MMSGHESVDSAVASSLARHLEFSPLAFAVTDGPEHLLRYANAAYRELEAQLISVSLKPMLDRSYQSGELIQDAMLDRAEGTTARWSCSVWPVANGASAPEGLMMEVRDVTAAEEERTAQRGFAERLLIGALREQDTARAAVDASRRAIFLAMVSRELAMSLDEEATRDVIQRRSLPRRGAWCIVDVVESNGVIHRLGVVHPNPAKQELARAMVDHWYPPADDPIGAPAMLRNGGSEPLMIGQEAAIAMVAAAHGEQNLAILQRLSFGALLIVPLVVRARVFGAITFVTCEGDSPFTQDEITLASDLADRCAMALDNARLHRETEALRVAADTANRAKSMFLGNMSHELRTPLNAIGGYVELLEMGLRGPVTSEQRIDLTRIKNSQQHLLKMITEILNFVRSESGRMEYRLAAVPIDPVLDEVAEMLAGTLKERTLKLDWCADSPGAVAWADVERVRQIVLNLVMNAVKYTADRGSAITLGCAVHDDTVTVYVGDDGPGIPADKREAIFEPFVQLRSGLANRQGGVGLGLAISRDIARGMNGDLTVESTMGVGSRFTLVLPRANGTNETSAAE